MTIALLFLGTLLLLLVFLDVLWTTLSTHGAGPIAAFITRMTWLSFKRLHRRYHSHRLLKSNIVFILIAILIFWLLLLWVGWLLIFSSQPEAVIYLDSGLPASLPDRIYFVGMTLFTLGTGDLVAATSTWRILMVVASFHGLVMITLAIAYLLPVIATGIDRRQLALSIWSLGDSPEEILINGWNGTDFDDLQSPLEHVAQSLIVYAERHLAYPVLQYFHATDPRADLFPRIANLEDALILLEAAVPPEHQPTRLVLRNLRVAMDRYMHRMEFFHIHPSDSPPPLPDLDLLRHHGIPLRDLPPIDSHFLQKAPERQKICGTLLAVGWQWGD